MLKDEIRSDLKEAMKAKDANRVGAIRMLLSALTYEETASGAKAELTDADVLRVIAREVKKRKESVEVYTQAGREELAAKEQAELEVLESYQPAQLSDAELEALVKEAIAAQENPQLGPTIKAVQQKAAGRADGRRISELVRAALA
ncbi:MAG: GatB/YqeY domain-containing protein [Corynebacterium sp.]|nr:GatB/YqeY domain-containing protein [Corynebacterium sp.]